MQKTAQQSCCAVVNSLARNNVRRSVEEDESLRQERGSQGQIEVEEKEKEEKRAAELSHVVVSLTTRLRRSRLTGGDGIVGCLSKLAATYV